MKRLLVLGASLLMATSVYANHMDANAKMSKADMKKDGEVVAFVETLNMNEVNAAKAVKGKKMDKIVADFAAMMIKDHTKAYNDTKALANKDHIKAVDTDKVKSMQKDGKELVKKLQGLKGKDLEKTYMDAMVKGHQDALSLIDDTLLPEVQGADLKKLVEDTRVVVEQHLTAAKEISDKLS